MSIIKIEVVEGEKYNTVYVSPRDDTDESRKQLDLILHAIMSTSPKRGGQMLGQNKLKIDVLRNDIVTDIGGSI